MKGIIGVLSGSFLILFLSFGCTTHNSQAELVRIFYLPQDLSLMTPIDTCDKIFYHSDILKDTIIKDKVFIKKLNEKIEQLTPSVKQDSLFDFRIRCVIKMKNGNKRVMCMGEFFDTVYEGKLFEDDPELFCMIKQVIYK